MYYNNNCATGFEVQQSAPHHNSFHVVIICELCFFFPYYFYIIIFFIFNIKWYPFTPATFWMQLFAVVYTTAQPAQNKDESFCAASSDAAFISGIYLLLNKRISCVLFLLWLLLPFLLFFLLVFLSAQADSLCAIYAHSFGHYGSSRNLLGDHHQRINEECDTTAKKSTSL